LRRLLASRPAFAITLIGACATTFAQGSAVLDLLWWVKERGYPESQAQHYLGMIFIAGGILGGIAGGIGGDRMRRSMPSGDLLFLGWVFLLAGPMTIAYRFVTPATPLFYALAFAGSMQFMLYFGPIYAALQEQVPANLRGAATGITIVVTTISNALGAAFAGYLADLLAQSGIEHPITAALRVCQTACLISVPCFFVAAKLLKAQQNRCYDDRIAALGAEDAVAGGR
jgi:predicted MFS family arabinose efflux permease